MQIRKYTHTLALVLALLGAAASSGLQAQGVTNFRFGLHLSPSISFINTDDARISGDGTAFGLKLATVAEYNFAPNYSIESGIGFHFNAGGTLLSTYGGRFFTRSLPEGSAFNSELGTEGQVELDYSIQYVEVPFALKLRTREFGYFTYYLQAPILALHIRSNARGTLSGGARTATDELAIRREVTPFGLSWGLGGGVEYSVAESTRLFGGVTFQRVFTDVTKDGPYTYTGRTLEDDPRASLNLLTFRFGVLF